MIDGGLGRARTIVNVHVPERACPEDGERVLAAFVRGRGLAAPWVGLCTAASTEGARIAVEDGAPATGWLVARATRAALGEGIRRWLEARA